MSLILDTNVVLDALATRVPFNVAAERIIILAAERKITAYIAATSVTDIYYILRRQLNDREATRNSVRKLINLLPVLDITASDCSLAFELHMHDYEDAVLAQCAKRHNIASIITRNFKDFINSPVPAITPDEFLKRHR